MVLTTEQIRIIDAKPNGHNLIKGVAGSGKTTVAVQKIPNLLNHYMTDPENRVLLVTYNKTLIQYIKHVFSKMDIQSSLFFPEDINKKIEIKTVDQIIYKLYYKISTAQNQKRVKELVKPNQRRDFLTHAIREVNKRYQEETIVTYHNIDFLEEELDWIKSCKYTDRETYLCVDRLGRMSREGESAKFALQKNSVHRNAIYDAFEIYERLLAANGFTDFKTMALVVLKAMNKNIIKYDTFPHIIIDESQDLTRVQIEIISKIYCGNTDHTSITFIADTAQSIYSHSWLASHSFKSIGFDMSGRARVLSKNHRTTMEIARAAYSMIEKDEEITKNENYVKPEMIEKHGDPPLYKHFQSDIQELEYVERLIKAKLCKEYNMQDIAILARTKAQLEAVKTYLIGRGIPVQLVNKQEQQFDQNQILLMTLHSIKGLEFPVIIIVGINDGILPYQKTMSGMKKQYESMERKLLYVGMTRAKSRLYLTSAKKASNYMMEIDPKFLMSGDHEFSPVYHIGIDQYRFKHNIQNRNSYEEMVRQWYIQELITKLGYPIEMIEIEYQVQAFSKSGFVDIALFEMVHGKKMPTAFIEIKRRDEDLTKAMVQLQQYIGCNNSVCYGVVSNGDSMICLQKKENSFQEIRQLPRYCANMANLYKYYEYRNLIDKSEYSYQINLEDKEEILIKKKNDTGVIGNSVLFPIPIYGKVAAGLMRPVYENRTDPIQVPKGFLFDEKNCFALEVDGDSMIDAEISKGDYVIVHRQQTAKRRDIVIAVDRRENEATMKRFDAAGEMAILTPENPKYEPIILPLKEVLINGVVIGVLKQ